MTSSRAWFTAIGVGALAIATVITAQRQLPPLGAGALLHPARRHVDATPPQGCREATFSGLGVNLAGWRCAGSGHRRGTLVYLHGAADNRESSIATIQRFVPLGFDVVAYDSRAHGDSGGDICTYGFFEKQDLRRVIDSVEAGPIVLIGGASGRLKGGRHLVFPAKTTMSNLLLSILNKFGIPLEKFGDSTSMLEI